MFYFIICIVIVSMVWQLPDEIQQWITENKQTIFRLFSLWLLLDITFIAFWNLLWFQNLKKDQFIHVQFMPGLHLSWMPLDNFVYHFRYNCSGITGGYGLQRMRLHCIWLSCYLYNDLLRDWSRHNIRIEVVRRKLHCYCTVITQTT